MKKTRQVLAAAMCLICTTAAAQTTTIEWDRATLRQISPLGGYPRMLRLDGRSVMVAYEDGHGNIAVRHNYDDREEWTAPRTVFGAFTASQGDSTTRVLISNPEIARLTDGTLMMACNYRPRTPGIYPFAIAVARSTDEGLSWSTPQVVYRAGKTFSEGCWEPFLLQLPGGPLHIYFSNEAAFEQSDEQEIAVMTSRDGGLTWDDPRQVCFTAGRRDGMPVACLAGDEILVSVEDNRRGQFKPAIVRSPLADPWKIAVMTDSPDRNYALAQALPDSIYAGAPYLLRLPSGEILISYQTTRGRTSEWELSTMEVAVGTPEGRDFGNVTQPFEVTPDQQAKWNSLALWDEGTVVALSAATPDGKRVGVWMIRGKITRKR